MEGVPSSRDYSPGLSTSEMSRQLEAAMASDQPSGIDLPMTKCAFELYQKVGSFLLDCSYVYSRSAVCF